MGQMRFGSPPEIFEIEDRTLAHIKLVMLTKLRRNESFAVSLQFDLSAGSGRETLWVHPSSQLSFRFGGSRAPSINREWLDALMLTANSTEGLRLIAETGLDTTGAIEVVRLEEPSHIGNRPIL
jgi:hypothetical protein